MKRKRDYYVTVCNACSTASCWHGKSICDGSKNGFPGTKREKASDLDQLGLEHASNYNEDKLREIAGNVDYVNLDQQEER